MRIKTGQMVICCIRQKTTSPHKVLPHPQVFFLFGSNRQRSRQEKGKVGKGGLSGLLRRRREENTKDRGSSCSEYREKYRIGTLETEDPKSILKVSGRSPFTEVRSCE